MDITCVNDIDVNFFFNNIDSQRTIIIDSKPTKLPPILINLKERIKDYLKNILNGDNITISESNLNSATNDIFYCVLQKRLENKILTELILKINNKTNNIEIYINTKNCGSTQIP